MGLDSLRGPVLGDQARALVAGAAMALAALSGCKGDGGVNGAMVDGGNRVEDAERKEVEEPLSPQLEETLAVCSASLEAASTYFKSSTEARKNKPSTCISGRQVIGFTDLTLRACEPLFQKGSEYENLSIINLVRASTYAHGQELLLAAYSDCFGSEEMAKYKAVSAHIPHKEGEL